MSTEPAPEQADETPEQEDAADQQPMPEEVAKASRRRMIIGLGGTILVLLVVFWFIFTFIVAGALATYDYVWAQVTEMFLFTES